MPNILHIETSTRVCSVAVSRDGEVTFERVDHEGPNHATVCGVFVEEALCFCQERDIRLDAVAVSQGPGSYTGLRIGVSMAKGVCYGRHIPLLAIPTLELLCVPLLLGHEELPDDTLFVPMLDARRMEVYAAIYDRALHEVRGTEADIVDGTTYEPWLHEHTLCFFGNGAAKCQKVVNNPHAIFVPDIEPLARHMMPLAERTLREGRIQDVAYFEPFYLKEFVATKPRNLLQS